jgi:hypothetical protein
MLYDIIRCWENGARRVLDTAVSLEVAQAHCNNPESSSRTCTSKEGKARTRRSGAWFDGYNDAGTMKGRRRLR